MRKGQISLEFVTSILFVIFILAFLIFTITDYVPRIEEYNQRAQVNLEARSLTEMLMTSPGYHTFRDNGTNWEKNSSTLKNAREVGLASDYHVIQKDKVMSLVTAGQDGLNYSRFREIANFENQYRFEFTVLPIINTHRKFTRTEPPRNPEIIEPENPEYDDSGNRIGYGSIRMGGTKYNALTTSHDGRYDTLYLVNQSSNDWNFTDAGRYIEGDTITLGGRNFEIEGFQNSGDKIGNIVVISRQLKTFGSALDTSATIIKLNRYAALEQPGADLHPLRIEVFSWN
jgi:hypothetical protein